MCTIFNIQYSYPVCVCVWSTSWPTAVQRDSWSTNQWIVTLSLVPIFLLSTAENCRKPTSQHKPVFTNCNWAPNTVTLYQLTTDSIALYTNCLSRRGDPEDIATTNRNVQSEALATPLSPPLTRVLLKSLVWQMIYLYSVSSS